MYLKWNYKSFKIIQILIPNVDRKIHWQKIFIQNIDTPIPLRWKFIRNQMHMRPHHYLIFFLKSLQHFLLRITKKKSTFQYDLEQIRYQLPSIKIPIFRVPHKSHPTQLWNSVQCLFKNHYICHVDVSKKTIKSRFSNGHGVQSPDEFRALKQKRLLFSPITHLKLRLAI